MNKTIKEIITNIFAGVPTNKWEYCWMNDGTDFDWEVNNRICEIRNEGVKTKSDLLILGEVLPINKYDFEFYIEKDGSLKILIWKCGKKYSLNPVINKKVLNFVSKSTAYNIKKYLYENFDKVDCDDEDANFIKL